MATSPVPRWAREQSPTHREPTIAGTLLLFAVVTLVLLAVLSGPTSKAEEQRAHPPPCAQHWPPTCPERGR